MGNINKRTLIDEPNKGVGIPILRVSDPRLWGVDKDEEKFREICS